MKVLKIVLASVATFRLANSTVVSSSVFTLELSTSASTSTSTSTSTIEPLDAIAYHQKRGLFFDLLSLCLSGGFPPQNADAQRYPGVAIFTRLNSTGELALVRSSPEAAAKSMWEDLGVILDDISELNTMLKNRESFEKLSAEEKIKRVMGATREWELYKRQYLVFGEREWGNLGRFKKEAKIIGLQDEIVEVFTSAKAFILYYCREYSIELGC